MTLHIEISMTRTICGKEVADVIRSPVSPQDPDVCPECLKGRRPGIETATFRGVSIK